MMQLMGPTKTDTDVQYSMRVVTRLTGLSPDTIRAWERRYAAVVPARTEGNTRRYSAVDVRRLGLLKAATNRGYRISDIANLSEQELRELVDAEGALTTGSTPEDEASGQLETAFKHVQQDYLEAIERFDARTAADQLARSAAIFSPRDFVLEVVLPIMRTTGDRWEQGSFTVAHEHLVSMQARSLLDAILRLSAPHKGAPKLITATPEGQLHEFGALAGAMLAALRGFDVLYLGAEVPAGDLLTAAEQSGAEVLLLSVIFRGTARETNALARSIVRIAKQVDTWVGIADDHPLTAKLQNAHTLHRFDDLDIALTKLVA